MAEASSREQGINKLGELIKDVKFAMLTTVNEDGSLRSRPMATQQQDFDGDLWFFTRADSGKTHDIDQEREVNVSYAEPEDHRYVSVSGRAMLVRDRAKIEELWKPVYKAWFPEGKDDPQLALIKVKVTGAEYWDSPNGVLVHLVGFAKAITTGEPMKPGDHKKLDLDQGTESAA